MGFANKFDGMFSSAYIGCGKEDRAFFAHILHKLDNLQAQEILFWDDSLANIGIARQAGLQAEQYSDFVRFCERMHGYVPMAVDK
jgi:HAD superfamily hydrolase (TIGR01509 family)